MRIRHWIICLLVTAGICGVQAQQPNPPAPDQPPSKAAAAGQAANGTSANREQGPQSSTPNAAAEREAVRNFLAIGAPPSPEAASRGRAIFISTCGFCHGTNATGGAQGPNLVRSTVVLHDQGTAKEIAPVVHNGRPGRGMPAFPNLSDAQMHDIAQFLLGRTQAAANRMEYTIQNIVTGDPKAGQVYFQSHCADCHSVAGDLAHIATRYEPVALQGRFLYPGNFDSSGTGAPPDPRTQKKVTVTLPSGVSYSGVLMHIDDFSVALRESSGVYRSWVYDDVKGIRVEVHDPLAQHVTLLHQYSDADMHNILAWLETLQ